ncbi:MAG TPA: 4-(cytidine 5'-diphospho)-2-C-methyl-D-erythritol kinase [Streptosporangiaceae bacterium]|nr:4-(cytidine 5'-diphospho)-2-C-methyl-D-erythritol kinase [Streptosporangiaceae bacterium]
MTRQRSTVTTRVPAKVNLQLSVGPLRSDGYHDLVSVFHAVSLYDEVTVRSADRTSVVVRGEGSGEVPTGPANLAVRAAAALARATGRRGAKGGSGVRIEIRKRIPVAAGLAGGSADAAGALVACNELWRAGCSAADLREIGAQLGSDVPFALAGETAVGIGRGEQLTRALVSGTYHWVLAFGASGLSTPEVYAACDRLRAARSGDSGTANSRANRVWAPELDTELMAALRSGDPALVGPLLSNDLQPAALSLQPLLRRALAAGRDNGALGAIVSGSGPTCAFLASDADSASDLAVAITGAGVCRAVVQVSGPVPGASLVDAGALA